MSELEVITSTIALSMGAAWASGINLYAVLLVLGLGGMTGNIALPEELEILQNPLVIGAAGLMYCVEFFADKIPGVDTGWDSIHTFVRIPAGAMLAASAVGDVTPALELAAGILGGTMAAGSHATKAGTRMMINTSPEPFSNWVASVSEDLLVLAGLWAALNHPIAFVVCLILFILFMIWFLPKLWRGIKTVLRKIGEIFGLVDKKKNADLHSDNTMAESPPTSASFPPPSPSAVLRQDIPSASALDKLGQLKSLLDQGAITQEEFDEQKKRLLG